MATNEILINKFRDVFGRRPTFEAFAPGRINLIGDHLDYNNCPVLPFAVNLRISAVFAPREDNRICVADSVDRRGRRSFAAEERIAPYETGDWGNYPKAAVQGVVTDKIGEGRRFKGFDAVIASDLPQAGGMSSSSAFVVLTGMIFCAVNGFEYPPIGFSSLMAAAERYVGTQGGGMDQAACVNGRNGKVLKIDFNPLCCRPFSVPDGISFVVADSLIKAQKTKAALSLYNSKPVESRMAAAVLNRRLPEVLKTVRQPFSLGDLTAEKLGVSDGEIDRAVFSVLREGGYTYEEAAAAAGMSADELKRSRCLMSDGTPLPEPPEGFALFRRVRHVLTERRRVERCARALEAGDAETAGRLMFESHASGRDDGGFSCPESDALTEIARSAGALGSRQTGAGFGGCCVSLVRSGETEAFKEKLMRDYYGTYLNRTHPEISGGAKASAVFTVVPSDGARIRPLSV